MSDTILTISVTPSGQVEVNFHRREEPLNQRQMAMLLAAATDCFARTVVACNRLKGVAVEQVTATVRDYYVAELAMIPDPSTFETTGGKE